MNNNAIVTGVKTREERMLLAHKRLLDPRIFKDEIFLMMTQKEALIYILLWDFVESNGCGKASAKLIKADLLPFMNYTKRFIAQTINRLAELKLIDLYAYGDQAYFYLRKFEEYQGFKNPVPSRIRGPEGCTALHEIDTETDNGLPTGRRRKKYTRKSDAQSEDNNINNINNNKYNNNKYTSDITTDTDKGKAESEEKEKKKTDEKGREETEMANQNAVIHNSAGEVIHRYSSENVEKCESADPIGTLRESDSISALRESDSTDTPHETASTSEPHETAPIHAPRQFYSKSEAQETAPIHVNGCSDRAGKPQTPRSPCSLSSTTSSSSPYSLSSTTSPASHSSLSEQYTPYQTKNPRGAASRRPQTPALIPTNFLKLRSAGPSGL